MKWQRRMRIVMFILLGLVVVWLLGDLIYSRIIASRLKQWEATIKRDEDGIQTGLREYTIGDGETAILLVHGINDSPRCWYKMAPALAEQGFTCRVMRLPGFAEPLQRYSTATKEQWISAVNGQVTVLRKKHSRVVIIAHSLGGAVTIANLLNNPNIADAVVLIAPAIEVSNRRSPVFSTRFWHEFGNWTLLFTQVTQTPFEIDTHDPAERDYPGRAIFTPRQMADDTFSIIDSNRGRAGEIKTPLMMVLSKDDQVVDWRAAKEFYEQVESPTKSIRYAEDAGHAIPVDNGWRELTAAIAEFIGQQASAE